MNILTELRRRNKMLFWFGLFNMVVGAACILLQFTDDAVLLGVNRWLKPMKFYLSVGIMTFTMNWLLYYLSNKKKVILFSWMIVKECRQHPLPY